MNVTGVKRKRPIEFVSRPPRGRVRAGATSGTARPTPVVLLWIAEPRLQGSGRQAGEAGTRLLVLVSGSAAMFGGLVPPFGSLDQAAGDGKAPPVAASIGIALVPEHGRSAARVLAHADAAMFQTKAAGCNRVQLYAPEPS